jgi:hypothetical protein
MNLALGTRVRVTGRHFFRGVVVRVRADRSAIVLLDAKGVNFFVCASADLEPAPHRCRCPWCIDRHWP